jgi:hypothetical protein
MEETGRRGRGEKERELLSIYIVHTSNAFGPTQPSNREARTRFMLDYSFFLFFFIR